MKKKLGSIALILSILAGILSGCGNSPSAADKSTAESVQPSENETAPGSEAAPAAPAADSAQPEVSTVEEPAYEKVPVEVPFAEGESVSMFLLIPPFISAQLSITNELTVLGELEKRTGLSFDITPGNYLDGSTDVNLLIASGDYPDIINHADLYSGGIEAAMEHNIVLDLHDYIMNDMPNFLATMKSYDVDALKQMTTASGRIGYFPQVHMRPYIDNFAIGLNQDVMDQLNLEAPKTFDQLHDVLSKVHEATGLQYGLSNQGTDAALMVGFGAPAFGATGAGIEGFRVVDGVVEYGATTDAMRNYLETMAQWFSEGLIYSDFLSYEDFQQTNMVAAGTLFGNGNVNAQTLGEAAGNEINITAIPYLTEKEGDPIQLKGSGEIVRSAAWSVSTGADADTVALICQLVDYIFSDEGTLLFNYGVEGQGYELDENGQPQWSDLIMNYEGGYTTAAVLYATATPSEFICGIYDDDKFNFSYTDQQQACQDIINDSSTGAWDFPVGADVAMTTEETAEAAAISGDLSTYVSETALSWICGQQPLNDETWENYLEKCQSMRAQELTELYQGVYDRFMEE